MEKERSEGDLSVRGARSRKRIGALGGALGAVGLAILPLVLGGSDEIDRRAHVVSIPRELLENGGFELPTRWNSDPGGFAWAPGKGRGGSRAIACSLARGEEEGGAFQTIRMDPPRDRPLLLSGWSRAVEVDGDRDDGYSLWVDVEGADGSARAAQTAPFRTGSHGWEKVSVRLADLGPIRSVTVHCLFRGHRGTVYFDDLSLLETTGPEGAVAFEGTMVLPDRPPRIRPLATREVATRKKDLRLGFMDDRIVSVDVDGAELAVPSPSGFFARDAGTGSDFFGFREGRCLPLGLTLETRWIEEADHLVVSAVLADTEGRDRMLSLQWALPVDLSGWTWHDDLRRGRRVQGSGVFSNVVPVPCGATGTISRYPVMCLSSRGRALGAAVDLGTPAQYRLSYHAGTRQLLVSFDLTLLHDSLVTPGVAEVGFILFRVDPGTAFRGALDTLYRAFPDFFFSRSREVGTWLPFQKAGDIPHWEDFGFVFHEGEEDASFDRAHGILSFRYSEPGLRWFPLSAEVPRSPDPAQREVARRAASPDGGWARAILSSGMVREDGGWAGRFVKAPWCDGMVLSVNPSPRLPGPDQAARLLWGRGIRDRYYGPRAPDPLAGEFIDSLEGYAMEDLDFKPEHLRYASTPPTWSRESVRPTLLKSSIQLEYLKWVAQDLRSMGKLIFANGVPCRFACLMPWVDVAGMEVDWIPDGRFRPSPDSDLAYWRALSHQKPYLLLFNSDFRTLTPELLERCFKRALFWGIFPSLFSPNAQDDSYWRHPSWFERDRPLFRKYVPLLRRLARAGWTPVSGATLAEGTGVYLEQFGPDAGGVTYFTLENPGTRGERARLVLPLPAPSDLPGPRVRELLSRTDLPVDGGAVEIFIPPGEVVLLESCPPPPGK